MVPVVAKIFSAAVMAMYWIISNAAKIPAIALIRLLVNSVAQAYAALFCFLNAGSYSPEEMKICLLTGSSNTSGSSVTKEILSESVGLYQALDHAHQRSQPGQIL